MSECFSSTDLTFLEQAKKWNKELNNIFHMTFKKVRVVEGKSKENKISNLLEERKSMKKQLTNCTDDKQEELKKKLEDIEVNLANESAEDNLKKVVENFGSFAKSDGFVNTNGMWRIKKRVFPKNPKIAPSAKLDFNGQLETNPENLKKLYLKTYQQRLRHRPIRGDLTNLKFLKETLFELRLEFVKLVKSKPPAPCFDLSCAQGWQQRDC